jgi:hypothetical protein
MAKSAAQDEPPRGRPTGSRNTSQVLEAPQFEVPPTTARSRAISPSKWTEVAEALRERPGEWARVSTHQTEESAKQAASGIRNGNRSGFEPKGTFDAVFGAGNDDDFGVWARYVERASTPEQGVEDEAEQTSTTEEPVGV